MKIALTSRGVGFGGIGRYALEIANRLSKNHEVHLFSTYFEGNIDSRVILHKVPSINGPLVINSIPFTLQNTLRFNLLNKDFSIVHCNGGECLNPDVITAHSVHKYGIKFRKNMKWIRGKRIHDIYALTTEWINYGHRKYKKVICDSTSSKSELTECYGVPDEDVEVIPLGVDLEEFRPMPKSKELMDKYGIRHSDFTMITVATEFYRKGIDTLIKAVYNLIKREYKVKLLVVGNPVTEGMMKNDIFYRKLTENLRIKNNIIFTGKVSGLPNYYNISDCFVSPTRYDAFGLPVIEALACSLPVITTNIGAGEFVKPRYNGLYFDDPNNVEEIADKIEELMDDYELRLRFRKNARSSVEGCSWDNVVKRTEKVYEEVLN